MMAASSRSAALGFGSPVRQPDGGAVLHIIGCRSVQYGSFEDNLVYLTAACSARGLRSILVYPREPAVSRFTADVNAAGGQVLVVPHTDEASLRGARAINRVIRSVRPKVVHAHFGRPGYVAIAMARAAGVPTVLLMKHHESWPTVSLGHRLALRALSTAADCVLCVSPVVEDEVLAAGVPARRVCVTPLGIDTERYAPSPELRAEVRAELGIASEQRLVLCVSHLREPKGIDVLLTAWDMVQSDSDAVLLLAGDGPLAVDLRVQATQLASSSTVRFLGLRQDIPRLLAACDLFVCPSLSEAGGLNIVEALSAGAPTVSTLVGVVRPLADEGLFVPVRPVGDPSALASAIELALADAVLREEIAVRGRDYVLRTLGLVRVAESLANLYQLRPPTAAEVTA